MVGNTMERSKFQFCDLKTSILFVVILDFLIIDGLENSPPKIDGYGQTHTNATHSRLKIHPHNEVCSTVI